MQPVQLDHCTLYAPDDSCMVRVDRKGRVVEPAELGYQLRSSSDPADSHQTPIVCLALFTMGRKRLKKKKHQKIPSEPPDLLPTFLELGVLWGMGRNINRSAVCVSIDWDGYYEGQEHCLVRA